MKTFILIARELRETNSFNYNNVNIILDRMSEHRLLMRNVFVEIDIDY